MSSPNDWNKKVIEEFRASGGKVGGYFEGRPVLLLHTTGAKTGQERVNPVAYVRDSGDLVVVASKGGAPTNPDWYHNLVANPKVTVEVGTDTYPAQATVTTEPERSRLYKLVIATHPGFAEYETKTTRKIPVMRLHPIQKG
jgi:deazaflavin-dependent oxidoreductase (nitroreductase family)